MSTQVQIRRGTTAEHATFTGAVGEITVDTDKDTVVVHDGSTAGGVPLAKDADVVKVSGTQSVAGDKTFSGATKVTNTTESTSDSTGALIVDGGVGIAKRLNVTGAAAIAGITTVSNTTASISPTTGALVVSGGVGIAGAANIGGAATVATNLTLTNGNLILGTAGNGIDFGATANSSGTMTSELLDDYEEGSWTPDFTTTGVDFTTMTVDIRSAVYTKVGRLVTVTAYIRTDNVDTTGATGNMIISGLPFTAVATTGWSAINISDVTAWVNAPVNGYIVPNTTDIYLNKADVNGNTQSLARTDFTSGATADQNTLIFSALYYTAT